MSSPRILKQLNCLSPRSVLEIPKPRSLFLSPKTPIREESRKRSDKRYASTFNVDTPNRMKLLRDGLPQEPYSVLGIGGFGTVFKASYKGNEVAAKIMDRRKDSNEIEHCRKIASRLKHSNIVNILSAEKGNTLSMITMELCGTSLQDRIDEGALSRSERVSIAKDVANALEFCHNAGIVHADVKPKNILFAITGQTKLTDFGSSVFINEENYLQTLHGTPGYMAPEVIKGSIPSPASDVFSLGIVLWQMLSRKPPFSGFHVHTILYLMATGKRPPVPKEDDLHGKYIELYKSMWAQDAHKRPRIVAIINECHRLIQF